MEVKEPADELQKLGVFEGTWKIDGQNFGAAPGGSNQPISGHDTYHWLDGNFFMVNNWKHTFNNDSAHKGISILGFDENEKKLYTLNFDNIGFKRRYWLEQNDNQWIISGKTERAERNYSEDGRSYEERWEIKTNDAAWVPLCVMHGTKQ